MPLVANSPAPFYLRLNQSSRSSQRIATRVLACLWEVTTMTRQHTFSLLALTFALSLLAALNLSARPASYAAEPAAGPANENDVAAQQIKDLQTQLAQLQSQVKELKSPHILSAGTVTMRLGPQQDNKTTRPAFA